MSHHHLTHRPIYHLHPICLTNTSDTKKCRDGRIVVLEILGKNDEDVKGPDRPDEHGEPRRQDVVDPGDGFLALCGGHLSSL